MNDKGTDQHVHLCISCTFIFVAFLVSGVYILNFNVNCYDEKLPTCISELVDCNKQHA